MNHDIDVLFSALLVRIFGPLQYTVLDFALSSPWRFGPFGLFSLMSIESQWACSVCTRILA